MLRSDIICAGLRVGEVRMGTYDMTAYLWRKDEVPMIYSSASVGTRKNGENLG